MTQTLRAVAALALTVLAVAACNNHAPLKPGVEAIGHVNPEAGPSGANR
jgi:hypothetical protein